MGSSLSRRASGASLNCGAATHWYLAGPAASSSTRCSQLISSGPPRGCLSSSARVSRSRFARRATAPTLRPALVEGDPVSNWPAGAERAWAGAPLSHLQGRAPHRAGALASRRPACWATADAGRSRSVTTPGEERSSGGLLRLVKILMSILAGRAWQGWAVRPTCVPPQHSNSVLSRYRQNPVLVLTVRAAAFRRLVTRCTVLQSSVSCREPSYRLYPI